MQTKLEYLKQVVRTIRNVFRGMNGFKEGHRPRRKMVDSNSGDRI